MENKNKKLGCEKRNKEFLDFEENEVRLVNLI